MDTYAERNGSDRDEMWRPTWNGPNELLCVHCGHGISGHYNVAFKCEGCINDGAEFPCEDFDY